MKTARAKTFLVLLGLTIAAISDASSSLSIPCGDATCNKQNYKDHKPALFEAADAGDPNAAYDLAMLLDKFDNDDVQSFRYKKQAAKAGLAQGQVSFGVALQYGKGGQKNVQEAMKWYKKAAEKGNSVAMYNLGVLYRIGDQETGLIKDVKKSYDFFLNASKKCSIEDMHCIMTFHNLGGMAKDGLLDQKKHAC